VFGILTFSARDSAKSQCPSNRCSGDGLAQIDHARTDATISTVGFGVGAVGAAFAVYFALRGGGHDAAVQPASARGLRVVPGVAGDGLAASALDGRALSGLTLAGSFD
jgi:hypothetical protein